MSAPGTTKPIMEVSHTGVNIFGPLKPAPLWPGRAACPIRAIVLHVMAGYYRPSIKEFHNPEHEASAHYCLAKDGRLCEVVDPFGPFAPWANGIPVDPSTKRLLVERTTLPDTFADCLRPGGPNTNWVTVSIECEGFPFDADFPTTAQYGALIGLLTWLYRQTGLSPDDRTLLGHWQFDKVDRPNCPGPHMDFGYLTRAVTNALHGPAAAPQTALRFASGFGVDHGFRAFFEAHGGIQVLGLPLSDEMTETIDGVARTVQYFERYKLVYFPEHKPPWDVQGADLGRQALTARRMEEPTR